jgi:hypothetical protein
MGHSRYEYIPIFHPALCPNTALSDRCPFCTSAGQEDFDRLRSLSYAETDAVIICFSVWNGSISCRVHSTNHPRPTQIDNPISLENVEGKVPLLFFFTIAPVFDLSPLCAVDRRNPRGMHGPPRILRLLNIRLTYFDITSSIALV